MPPDISPAAGTSAAEALAPSAASPRSVVVELPGSAWRLARDAAEVRKLEEGLLAEVGKATDGYLSRLDRKVSVTLSRVLLRTPVTPNQITWASISVGLAGAALIASSGIGASLLGSLLVWISAILDGCDGEIARLKLLASRFGARLDLFGDHVVNFAVLAAVAVHVRNQSPGSRWWPVAAALLAAGVVGSAVAVGLATVRRAGDPPGGLDLLIERLASRDFVYLLVPLCALGRLDLLFYGAAVGSNLFWAGTWAHRVRSRRRRYGAGRKRPSGLLQRFERLGFAVGLLLLGWLLYRTGPSVLAHSLAMLGWGILAVVALHAVSVFFNTLSWRSTLRRADGVSVRALAPMLVAGDAINAVSPVGVVPGELTRASLLRGLVPGPVAAGSVGLAALTQFVAQVLFILSGVPAVLPLVADAGIRAELRTLAAVLAGLLLALILVASSPQALATAGRGIRRIPGLRAVWSALPDRWRRLGGEIAAAVRERSGAFTLSVLASLAAWQAGIVETFLILRLLHVPVSWSRAFAIEALAVAIDGAIFFVPARMGTQEGSKVLIFVLLGLDPAKGLSFGVVRRIRELAWAAAGLAWIGRRQRGRRAATALVRLPAASRELEASR
ncbi:MAG: lysylphosphatidylglycerol synthase domain-containing protein [Thermoanaerobaculia bacterium]